MSLANPLAFSSLREWLGDFLISLKNEKNWSLREISRHAKLASGYLPMVLSGKRRLSLNALEKLLNASGASEEIKEAAKNLYTISESEIESERINAYKAFVSKAKNEKITDNNKEVFKYLSEELLVELREMTFLKDSGGDADWYRKRLKKHYDLPTVKNALAELVSMGFLKKEKNKWVATEKSLQCNDGVFSLSLGAFHKRMLEFAQVSISDSPRSERHLEGYTMALNKKNYEKAVDIILNTVSKLKELEAKNGDGDEVFHFEAALFPLTQNFQKKNSKEKDNS